MGNVLDRFMSSSSGCQKPFPINVAARANSDFILEITFDNWFTPERIIFRKERQLSYW